MHMPRPTLIRPRCASLGWLRLLRSAAFLHGPTWSTSEPHDRESIRSVAFDGATGSVLGAEKYIRCYYHSLSRLDHHDQASTTRRPGGMSVPAFHLGGRIP